MTGRLQNMDLDITQKHLDRWLGGEHIQDVMPHLSDEEREFLISGMTPADWDIMFDDTIPD